MERKIVERPGFFIIGIEVRTNNSICALVSDRMYRCELGTFIARETRGAVFTVFVPGRGPAVTLRDWTWLELGCSLALLKRSSLSRY